MSDNINFDGAEKRQESRSAIAHQFTITHESIGEIVCDARDLSLQGAFLLGDFSWINIGGTISVSFKLSSKGSGSVKLYRFNAIVVRITEEGAGLNFVGLDVEIDAAIFDLMHR